MNAMTCGNSTIIFLRGSPGRLLNVTPWDSFCLFLSLFPLLLTIFQSIVDFNILLCGGCSVCDRVSKPASFRAAILANIDGCGFGCKGTAFPCNRYGRGRLVPPWRKRGERTSISTSSEGLCTRTDLGLAIRGVQGRASRKCGLSAKSIADPSRTVGEDADMRSGLAGAG